METPDMALEEIGRLIAEGFKRGLLNNSNGSTTSWELKTDTWDDGNYEEEAKA